MKQLFAGVYYFLCGIMFLTLSCKDEAAVDVPADMAEEGVISLAQSWPDSTEIMQEISLADVLFLSNPDSAMDLSIAAAHRSVLLGFRRGAARAFYNIAELHSYQGQYDSSLFYLKHALYHGRHLPATDGLVQVIYMKLGGAYYKKSMPDSAAFYLYRGLQGLDQVAPSMYGNVFQVYRSLAAFCLNADQDEAAMIYIHKAERLVISHRDSGRLVSLGLLKAGIYTKAGKTDSARMLYRRAIESAYSNAVDRMEAHFHLANIIMETGDQEHWMTALSHYQQALALIQGNSLGKYREIKILFGLGAAYMRLGRATAERSYFFKAEPIFTALDTMQGATSLREKRVYVYRHLAYINQLHGAHTKAYEYSVRALDLQDSLYHLDRLKTIANLEFKYQLSEKDRQLARNELQISLQQNEIQRQYLWIGGILAVSLSAVVFFVGMLRRRKHKAELATLKSMVAGEERERVRLAQELHDGIVSQLSAIKMNLMALPATHPDMNEAFDDYHEILQQLEQSIGELRATSHNLLPQTLEQVGLLRAVKVYCDKISKITRCQISFLHVGELPPLQQVFELTVYRIIQEFVQNIMKHSGAQNVLIQFHRDEEILRITIDDDGMGTPPEQWPVGKGIGLQNVRKRIRLVGGSMEAEAAKGRGTSVYLTFGFSAYTKAHED